MRYIKLSFIIPKKSDFSDIVVAKLNEIEFESFVENSSGIDAYIQEQFLIKERLDSVITEMNNYFSFDYSVEILEQENWNKKWEENFEMVQVNNDCVIRAKFHKKTDCKYDIIINPKMSFGTGHHETTFLMMNEMFNMNFKAKSVLDVGCGTGILSILAKKLGSIENLGIDIDEWSYENSQENAKLNNINSINFLLGDASNINGKFDIILANINRNIILSDIDKYISAMNQDSDLILSGFLSEDVLIIQETCKIHGLALVSQKNKNKWNLLHFTN